MKNVSLGSTWRSISSEQKLHIVDMGTTPFKQVKFNRISKFENLYFYRTHNEWKFIHGNLVSRRNQLHIQNKTSQNIWRSFCEYCDPTWVNEADVGTGQFWDTFIFVFYMKYRLFQYHTIMVIAYFIQKLWWFQIHK